MPRLIRAGAAVLVTSLLTAVAAIAPAAAQQPPYGPPATVLGSVADSSGQVAPDLVVTALIGDVECGTGNTYLYGKPGEEVTLYVVDVVVEGQTAGCGRDGAEIRVRIGEREAEQTATWRAGAVRLDLTFGDATPAPIPSPSPTATRPAQPTANTSDPSGTPETNAEGTPVPAAEATEDPSATIPAGSPGAGSPVPTRAGGVTSAQANAGGGGGDSGGFPIWGIVMLVLGGIAAVGGGVGYAISRNRNDEDALAPPAP